MTEQVQEQNDPVGMRLRLLSYNIQVGINTNQAHHYLTGSWRHILPHATRFQNLDKVALQISDYDIVGLQEMDAGSFRSNFVNLTEYLAHKATFPFWHHRVNRRIGHFARHSSAILSRIRPSEVVEHKLPGFIPGRGMIVARYGNQDESLAVFNIHLSLSRSARKNQIAYIADLSHQYDHVVIMGDMNTRPESDEMQIFFQRTQLREPLEEFHTFPSWQPISNIDHILVTPGLDVVEAKVLSHSYSDHLPIAMEVIVPESVNLL